MDSGNKFQFEMLNLEEIQKMDIPERKDLIKDLIQERSFNFLAGEEGCGKSILAMNFALSIVGKREKFLDYEIKKHGSVLYLNNELHYEDYCRRIQLMMSGISQWDKEYTLYTPKTTPLLDECWEDLNAQCEKLKPVLVIVDCLYFMHDKEEKDNTEMKEVMRKLIKLRDDYSLCVLVLHHTKKGSSQEKMHNDLMRGAGAFGQSADTVLMLMRAKEKDRLRWFKPTKLRHVSDSARQQIILDLDDNGLWFKSVGLNKQPRKHRIGPKRIDFKMIFNDSEELKREEILKKCTENSIKLSSKTIDREIERAVGQNVLEPIGCGRYKICKN